MLGGEFDDESPPHVVNNRGEEWCEYLEKTLLEEDGTLKGEESWHSEKKPLLIFVMQTRQLRRVASSDV